MKDKYYYKYVFCKTCGAQITQKFLRGTGDEVKDKAYNSLDKKFAIDSDCCIICNQIAYDEWVANGKPIAMGCISK